jgi:hypothetical protein
MVRNNPVSFYDPDGNMPLSCLARNADADDKPEAYQRTRRRAVGIPEDDSPLPATTLLARRRLAVGVADTERSQGINTLAVKRPPALLMVKEEAKDDQRQVKQKNFVNLQDERDKYEITIRNGKLFYKEQLLDTKENGRFKFIQDHNGALYGAETSDNPEGIKHSSLLGDEWPVSAGTISASEGEVIQLTSSSGHFRPGSEHLDFTKNYMQLNGVSILQVNPFFGDGKKTRRVNRSVASYKAKYMSSSARPDPREGSR